MPRVVPGKEAHPGKQGNVRYAATEEDLNTIYQLAAAGKSIKIIALRLGVSRGVLDAWLGNLTGRVSDPRVREAWEAGIAEHEEMLSSTLHDVISDRAHRMQVPATMFMLKVKHKWCETQAVEVSAKQTAPNKYVTKDITPEGDE
jgi:hypothetical protein